VEVYGAKKRGVAYSHQGQRVGRPHVATWAETETVLATDLGDDTDDPRVTAPGLLRRALAACRNGRGNRGGWPCAPTPGNFAGQLARTVHDAHIGFAIGARRIASLWRLLAGLADDDWHDARQRLGRAGDQAAFLVRGSRHARRREQRLRVPVSIGMFRPFPRPPGPPDIRQER
jgi:hypothetical protein